MYGSLDFRSQQLVMARRQSEPVRVVDRTVPVRKDDDGVLAVQQVIDLFVDALHGPRRVPAEVSQFGLPHHAPRSQRRTRDRPTSRVADR
jgi:hypothetical protein